ncbi:MAG: hypothetical protein IIB54_01120 [Planctomycetes bacterium]|nr:hypothetical protein [Planctomycetota bacterium]
MESKPIILPRGLIFLSSLWLIGSWIITMGHRQPIQISSASYTPSFRLMLLCIVIGLMIGWPLLRLSRQAQHHPIIHTFLDLSVLISLVQIILWPLRLITPWSSLRTASVDATICGWLLIAGAIVASVMGSERRGPRNLAMFACVCLCLLGPALASIGFKYGFNDIELIELSPLMAVHTLTDGGGSQPTAMQWRWIGLLGIAALAMWSVLIAFTMFRSRPSPLAD